jgi:AcrR family transcriptional regulator
MSQKRLSSEERKKEILNTALEIIHKKGFYKLTIRNIADKIGISEAAIYRHFKNKEDLINNLANLVFTRDYSHYDVQPGDDFFQLLKEIMYQSMEKLKQNPHITAIAFQGEIFREYPNVKEKFNQHRKQKEKLIISIVKAGQEKGCFNEDINPESFALLYLGGMRMTVLKWRSTDFTYPIDDELEKVLSELFKILRKE